MSPHYSIELEESFTPAYFKLLESGELERRAEQAWKHMEDCDLCARYCHVYLRYFGNSERVHRRKIRSYNPEDCRCVDLLSMAGIDDGFNVDAWSGHLAGNHRYGAYVRDRQLEGDKRGGYQY